MKGQRELSRATWHQNIPAELVKPGGNRRQKRWGLTLARIIHEDFYYNRRYAATTSLTAGGLAAQSVNILFKDA
ncbi:MAG: hypothetical protein HY348_13445, partial [Nitrospira defluvii]|nr:hypothetical protein [Nitrospira defluvii]